tara:strand:+ start:2332 stop:2574 length:243 start_codon:yes stop_codon:yes gene_type:complete
MKVEIREIGDVNNKKRVAFTITSDNQQKYLIDKSVTLSSKKSNDDYIKEAYDLAKPEIDNWMSNIDPVGKTYNPSTGKVE